MCEMIKCSVEQLLEKHQQSSSIHRERAVMREAKALLFERCWWSGKGDVRVAQTKV